MLESKNLIFEKMNDQYFNIIEKYDKKNLGNVEINDSMVIIKVEENYEAEAVTTILDYCFYTLDFKEIKTQILSNNLNSIENYNKLGFSEYDINSTTLDNGDTITYICMKINKPIVNINDIINDIENKLNIKVDKKNIEYYTDGTTESIVFNINKKYLVKTTDKLTLKTQIEFLNKYKDNYFQNIIAFNEQLKYICFDYIDGIKVKNFDIYDKKYLINQIYDITNNYLSYEYDGYGYLFKDYNKSWYQFLYDEVMYSSTPIKEIDIHIVLKSLNIIKEYNVDKYLIHGDFGVHNFLLKNNKIKVIDPMGVIGDKLYDFYFACLSSYSLFKNIELTHFLEYYNYNSPYKKALFIIVFYIRMSRAKVHSLDSFNDYLDIYSNELQKWI